MYYQHTYTHNQKTKSPCRNINSELNLEFNGLIREQRERTKSNGRSSLRFVLLCNRKPDLGLRHLHFALTNYQYYLISSSIHNARVQYPISVLRAFQLLLFSSSPLSQYLKSVPLSQ